MKNPFEIMKKLEKLWDYISFVLCGNQKNLFKY